MKRHKPAISMLINAIGSMNFHAKFISWSIRNRGNVPRTQMNTPMSANNLAKNQK